MFCFLSACGGDAPATKDAAKETKKAGDKADDKAAEKAAEKPAEEAKEVHFDATHDKSGIVARAATALEAEEKLDSEDLRVLSHHAENMPSIEAVCKHVAELQATTIDVNQCVKDTEHYIIHIGPELYAEFAACEMAATNAAELAACRAAEEELEAALTSSPHGEGLDDATCEAFFVKFEELAMADAGEGDQAQLVKEILEDVKADVINECKLQGTKAEVECATNSKTMHELAECASNLI